MTEDIKKALQQARENKTPIKGPLPEVEWELLVTTQVAKRNNVTGAYSELSVMKINGEYYSVVHHMNKMPSPSKVFYGEKCEYKAINNKSLAITLKEGIIAYRDNNLEKEYVNMYSFLWGYCCSVIDLKQFDLF